MANSETPQLKAAWLMARKIGVTLVGGTLTYFIAEKLIDDNGPMAIMTSVFVAGVLFVAQFLLDLAAGFDQLKEAQRRHLDGFSAKHHRQFNNFSHGTEVAQRIGNSNLPAEDISNLVIDAARIDERYPGLPTKLVAAHIKRLCTFLRQLRREGTFVHEGEDRENLLLLTEIMQTSLKACSLPTVDSSIGSDVADGGWWHTDLGRRYLSLQHKAVMDRRVQIQRLFIITPEVDPTTEAVQKSVRLQRENGIEVRFLSSDELGGTRSTLEDFIVFDDVILYKTRPTLKIDSSKSAMTVDTEISLEDEDPKSSRLFDTLWEKAKDEKPT